MADFKVSENVEAEIYKPFVTRWYLATAGTITLPLWSSGDYDFVVDWGDDSTDQIKVWNQAERTHTYSTAGTKTITILGKMTGWGFNNGGSKGDLRAVLSGGYTGLVNLEGGFYGCFNTTYFPNESEWLKNVTNMRNCFRGCAIDCDISKWDVGNVTNMESAFLQCINLSSDMSQWDVSKVQNFGFMFQQNFSFNGNVSAWDVSSATDMYAMFNSTSFNDDISRWDVSKVQDFGSTFSSCASFDQDLSKWDTSSATRMSSMFNNSISFNSDITGWDTSNVTDFINMFNGADAFNQDIGSSWDFSSVTNATTNLSGMITDTLLSGTGYDNLLINWNGTSLTGMTVFMTGMTRTAASATAYSNLTTTKTWSITDGGQV